MQAGDGLDRPAAHPRADWTPPTGALGALVAAAEQRAHASAPSLDTLRARCRDLPAPPPFAAALRRSNLAIIAEIKRASPSKGVIAPALDAVAQAQAYVEGGAAAISVLTEPDRFGGSLDDLAAVCAAIHIPAIRKDFIVQPVQIWEARAHGASAVLLIARGLDPDALPRLYDAALEAGLEALVEVRDHAELARALAIGATVIGVNNRNLETLIIDPATAPHLIRSIPGTVIAVAESGMAVLADAAAAQDAGADSLLIGSAVSAASDPASAVAEFAALPRHERLPQRT